MRSMKKFANLILNQSCKDIYLGLKCNSKEKLPLRDSGKSGSSNWAILSMIFCE